MEPLSREDILGADDLTTEKVEIPEWKGYVRVKTMIGTERDKFEAAMIERRGKKVSQNMQNFRAKLVSLTVVDEEGIRLFTDQDVTALGKKNAKALDRIFSVSQDLNKFTPEDVEELTEELNGNPSEGSVSD